MVFFLLKLRWGPFSECITKSFSNFLLTTCSLTLHSLKINKTKQAPEYVYPIRSCTKKILIICSVHAVHFYCKIHKHCTWFYAVFTKLIFLASPCVKYIYIYISMHLKLFVVGYFCFCHVVGSLLVFECFFVKAILLIAENCFSAS